MPVSIDFDELAQQCFDDSLSAKDIEQWIVLTPNSRTQKAVISGYLASLETNQVTVSPKVFSLKHWVDSLWSLLSFSKVLPRPVSQLEIKFWLKEAISQDPDWQLTNELGIAEKLVDTFRNLNNWCLELDTIEVTDTREQAYFKYWIERLNVFLSENNLICEFQKLSVLNQSIDALTEAFPKRIIMCGFNEITPLEKKFIEFLESFNVEVRYFYPKRENRSTRRIVCRDEIQEIEAAAAIAKQISEKNLGSNIGVVIHQLSTKVDLVHEYFSDYFQPDEKLPWQGLQKCRYNVSAGQPLSEVPQIIAATNLLRFKSSGLSLQELRFLKNSPFIDWGNESKYIKRFLHLLSLKALPKYSTSYLSRAVESDKKSEKLNVLKARINQLSSRQLSARRISVWGDVWRNYLQAWGWCENEEQKSSKVVLEFSQVFASLHRIVLGREKLSHQKALEFFLQFLRQTPFQLPSDRTDVHILGILEALGLEFDHLILVGFSRENWPQKANISPFLPLEFQREHNMPGSSAEREFNYAEDASQSLLSSANEIVITDRFENDQYQTAQFFEHFSFHEKTLDQFLKTEQEFDADYQWVINEKIEMPQGRVRGGAYLLSNYASCPFKALSRHLLKLEEGEEAEQGIDARVRGTWLHSALEYFWDEVKTQQQLKTYSEEDLRKLVTSVVSKSHKEQENILYACAPVEVVQIEFEKMIAHILEWLEIEKLRRSFIASTEVTKSLTLAGLDFTFKIDRLDRFDDGSQEIIDYKTGNVSVKKWLDERPEEAQMPAYVVACENEVTEGKSKDFSLSALSYVKVKTGEIGRYGINFSTEKPEAFEQTLKCDYKKLRLDLNPSDSTKPIFERWRENLTELAENIASGYMPVSPKSIAESCQYCEFDGFCRIQEAQPEAQDTSEVIAQKNDESGTKQGCKNE